MDQSVEFWSYCKRRFITTAVVLAYFMYPDLSENIANIFSCYPVQFGTYADGYTGTVSNSCPACLLSKVGSAPAHAED